MKDTLATLIPILIVLVCLPAALIATPDNTGGTMTEPKPSLPMTVGLWTRPESPQLITTDTIFDYMNGAGERYLGYCFDQLEVYEYKASKQKEILVELYYMKNSDDAFGLLSLDWGGDTVDLSKPPSHESSPVQSEWPRALYGKGLLRLWSDTVYARVMAYQETPESKEAVLSLGRTIAEGRKNLPQPELMSSPPDTVQPGWTLLKDRISFFRTHLVLNSLYYLGHENMLDLDHSSRAVSAVYEKEDPLRGHIRIQLIKIKYASFERALAALARFHKSYLPEHPLSEKSGSAEEIGDTYPIEDGWLGYKLSSDSITFVFECPDRETARAILDQIN